MDVFLEQLKKKEPELGLTGLADLYKKIMNDYRPPFAKGIYVFIETEDNWASSFRAASDLIKKDAATEVFSVYHDKLKGSPGYGKWKDKLERFVGVARVKYITIDNPGEVNTLTESIALIKFAHETKRDSLYLIAPPFHLLRVYMTAASVAIKRGSDISLFAYPGVPQNFNQVVTHSQGEAKGTRAQIFEKEELPRIKKYSNQNDILPIRSIMDYMEKRRA